MNRKSLGSAGEERAADFLIGKGYRILAKNYRTRNGEIDLIAEIDDTLVFVEVKLRTSSAYGRGIEAVTQKKAAKIQQIAIAYISKNYEAEPACRFDVIEINSSFASKITHIENAF
ncbi:MAG: YraN family protein [Clostridia bacterium]|nr:YraN family protein [Clostridia bacterium]